MVAMAWRSAITLKRRAARWLCWVPRSAAVWPERVVMALKTAPLGAPDAGAEPDGEAAAAAEAAMTTVRVPAAATMMSLFCFRLMIRWRAKVTLRSIARAAEGARSAMFVRPWLPSSQAVRRGDGWWTWRGSGHRAAFGGGRRTS